MSSTFSSDTVFRVWDDQTGERWEVRPGADGPGLIDFVYVSHQGQESPPMTLPRGAASLLFRELPRESRAREADDGK